MLTSELLRNSIFIIAIGFALTLGGGVTLLKAIDNWREVRRFGSAPNSPLTPQVYRNYRISTTLSCAIYFITLIAGIYIMFAGAIL